MDSPNQIDKLKFSPKLASLARTLKETNSQESQDPPRITAKQRLLPVLESISINRYLLNASTDVTSKSSSEADEARYAFAARFISAAMEGRNIVTAGDMFQVHPFAKLLRHWIYQRTIQLIIIAHLLLPIWSCDFGTPMILLQLSIICVYVVDVILHAVVFGTGLFFDKRWEGIFALLVLIQLVTVTWSTIEHGLRDSDSACLVLHLSEFVRPYILISKMQALRHVFTNIMRTMWSTKSILGVAFVIMMFYSVLGVSLFNSKQVTGYDSNNDNFDSFLPALLTLYVLTTEENFPFVTENALDQRQKVALSYFVSFLFVFMVVILPLMLGTVLECYASNHALQVSTKRAKARRALLVAYYIIDDDGVRGVTYDQLEKVLLMTTTAFTQPQIKYIWSKLVKRNSQPPKGQHVLRVQDFLDLAKYLHTAKLKTVHHTSQSLSNDPYRQTFLTRFQVSCQYIISRSWYRPAAQLNTVLLAILSVCWYPQEELNYIECAGSTNLSPTMKSYCIPFTWLHTLEGSFLIIFALEIIVIMVAKGPMEYLNHSKWQLFDFILLISSWVAHIALTVLAMKAYDFENHQSIGDIIDLPRAVRILRIITVFNVLKVVCRGLHSVYIVVGQIVLLYCSVSYSFAILGMALFSGAGIPSDEMGARFSYSTFSDSLYTMLLLTCKNNWNDVLYPLIEIRGRWSALYFVVFMLFCSTIMLDVLIGVVIEGIQVAAMYEMERKTAKYGIAPGTSTSTTKIGRKKSDKGTSQSTLSTSRDVSISEPSDHSPSDSFSAPLLKKPVDPLPQMSFMIGKRLGQEDMFRGNIEEEDSELSDTEVMELESTIKLIEIRMKSEFHKSTQMLKDSSQKMSDRFGHLKYGSVKDDETNEP